MEYLYSVMQIAVVAKDSLAREGTQSVLANEGRMHVAGGGEHVSEAARFLGGVGVLVVLTEGFHADDWVQLGEVKALGSVRIVLVERAEFGTGFKAADGSVRTSEGASGLVNVVRRIISEAGLVGMTPSVPLAVREAAANLYGPVGSYNPGYGAGRRGLTRREMDVARMVAQGMSNRRISQVLELQEQSIKNLVSSIMRKLQCDNRVQIALKLTGNPTAPNDGTDDENE